MKYRKDKPRYLYHLTHEDLGDNVFLKKNVPMSDDEPQIERICCSIFPSKCFVAINVDTCRDLHLYRSKRKLVSYHPENVGDSEVTKERWLFGSRKFERILTIKTDTRQMELIQSKVRRVSVGCVYGQSLQRAKEAAEDISRLSFIRRKLIKNKIKQKKVEEK